MVFSQNVSDGSIQNIIKIQKHIESNPDCKMQNTVPILLQGQMTNLPAYRLPLEMTFYNIKNGRFAAEYANEIKKKNRQLDPTNSEDSKIIQNLLIGLDLKQSIILQDDLRQYGQKDPGIITHDGFVINGNRRRAVLEKLTLEGYSQFKFIVVAILPEHVSSQDLWKIEAGIQLSRHVQLNYGPINELLKFKEGLDAGLRPIEMAKSLYGGIDEKDIIKKLEQYQLVVEYLNFIGENGVFNRAKGIHEHFVDLHNIIERFQKNDPSVEEIVHTKHIVFQLIHDGVHQRDIRKIKNILENEQVRKEFWEASEHSKPESASVKKAKKNNADRLDEFTQARIIFNNCIDSMKILSEKEQPEKLLRRALKNLEAIDPEHSNLNEPEIISLIERSAHILKNLHP